MCDQREDLIEYVYDECGADVRRRVDEHLTTCETCRDELGAMRRVRHDLLAWDVPNPGSVWKPFAPPPRLSVWRELPGWALAAAASLMFLVGAAGGIVTHALVTKDAPAPVTAAASPTGLTDKQLAALEARLRDVAKVEVDTRMLLVPAHEPSVGLAQVDRLENLISDSRQEHISMMTGFQNTVTKSMLAIKASTLQRVTDVEQAVEGLTKLIQQQQGGIR